MSTNTTSAEFVKRDKSASLKAIRELQRKWPDGPPSGLQPQDSAREPDPKRHAAFVQGGARTRRKAAEVLKALDAGAPLSSVEIPPGVIIDPTPEQIAEQCQPLGLKPPTTIPEGGWRSPIFMSALQLPPPEIFEERPENPFYNPATDEIHRPGVSAAFLRAQEIRHVGAEEAESLLDLRLWKGGSGIWIPYHDLHKPGALMVNSRAFGRLRLDKPGRDAKYLSPRNSGAQLYVPTKAGPFGKELVICEGEFKACALCDAGSAPLVSEGSRAHLTKTANLSRRFRSYSRNGRTR